MRQDGWIGCQERSGIDGGSPVKGHDHYCGHGMKKVKTHSSIALTYQGEANEAH